jgi:hypothetical protein
MAFFQADVYPVPYALFMRPRTFMVGTWATVTFEQCLDRLCNLEFTGVFVDLNVYFSSTAPHGVSVTTGRIRYLCHLDIMRTLLEFSTAALTMII